MQSDGQPLKVSLEGFNVTVGKEHDEYEFALKLNLVFKPQPVPEATQQLTCQ